eukprot:6187315-Pleurochrysis_carterae.AAC.1
MQDLPGQLLCGMSLVAPFRVLLLRVAAPRRAVPAQLLLPGRSLPGEGAVLLAGGWRGVLESCMEQLTPSTHS